MRDCWAGLCEVKIVRITRRTLSGLGNSNWPLYSFDVTWIDNQMKETSVWSACHGKSLKQEHTHHCEINRWWWTQKNLSGTMIVYKLTHPDHCLIIAGNISPPLLDSQISFFYIFGNQDWARGPQWWVECPPLIFKTDYLVFCFCFLFLKMGHLPCMSQPASHIFGDFPDLPSTSYYTLKHEILGEKLFSLASLFFWKIDNWKGLWQFLIIPCE